MPKSATLDHNAQLFRLAIDEVTNLITLVATSKKLLKAEATGLKNLQNALVAAGFTEEQATFIVAHQGLRTAINTQS